MRWIERMTIVFVGLFLAHLAVADEGMDQHPGYVAIDTASIVGSIKPNVEVSLEKPILRMLVGASVDQNPEVADLLSQIDLIQVKVFEDLGDKVPDLLEKIADRVEALKNEGWSQVLRVPGEEELVEILLRSEGDGIAGLAVFVAEPDEWVFVNLVGMIDPELFGRFLAVLGPNLLEGDVEVEDLAEALGFGEPEEYDEEMEELLDQEVELSDDQLQRCVGEYMVQSGEFGGETIHIELSDEGELLGSLGEDEEQLLVPLSETQFVIPEIEGLLEFQENKKGEFSSLTLEAEGQELTANRI